MLLHEHQIVLPFVSHFLCLINTEGQKHPFNFQEFVFFWILVITFDSFPLYMF
jgi:hypothetical protein